MILKIEDGDDLENEDHIGYENKMILMEDDIENEDDLGNENDIENEDVLENALF